ncbi:MAG: hypothetical protein WBA97_02480 [Actinophytocola sp.]|uniref:hypothetical protein n=1 Tax=Actinophytocola sp. TaxID=1872138 RepID=UPI003C71441E
MVTYWNVVLVLGAVVILALFALLSLLVHFVKQMDLRVAAVRDTLAAVTEHTANTALIPRAAESVDAVLAEGLRHHAFLGHVTSGGEP